MSSLGCKLSSLWHCSVRCNKPTWLHCPTLAMHSVICVCFSAWSVWQTCGIKSAPSCSRSDISSCRKRLFCSDNCFVRRITWLCVTARSNKRGSYRLAPKACYSLSLSLTLCKTDRLTRLVRMSLGTLCSKFSICVKNETGEPIKSDISNETGKAI